jgi:hypothetical protein
MMTEDNLSTDTIDAPVADTAAPDLDALLAEFDTATQQAPAEQAPVDYSAEAQKAFVDHFVAQRESLNLDARQVELRAQEQQLQQERDSADGDAAVKAIRGSLDERFFNDDLIEGWLAAKNYKDPSVHQVWMARANNPHRYRATLERLASEFQQAYGPLRDTSADSDHAMVAQAVRGASQKAAAEPPPDFGRMTNREFDVWKRDNLK